MLDEQVGELEPDLARDQGHEFALDLFGAVRGGKAQPAAQAASRVQDANDPNESCIIKQVFKDYAYRIPISSSKSYFGHPLGAAGGLESIVTLLIMESGVIAPTANLENPDVDFVDKTLPHLDKRCDLDYVPIRKREKSVRTAMSESFGFGGQNSVVIFKKLKD